MTGMNKDSMNDNLNERSMRDILSDEIDRQLKENPPKKPSLEEFKAMAYKRLEENDSAADTKTVVAADTDSDSDNRETVWTKIRANKYLRTACVVACFAAAFVIGGAIFSAVTSDVDADKNPKEEIVTENGVIIEDGGWGSSVGEENVVVFNEWAQVEEIKSIYPEMLIPQYVPKEYIFKMLEIETIETNDITGEYNFCNNKNSFLKIEIRYKKVNKGSLSINDVASTIESSKGKVYIQEYENKIATVQLYDGTIINICGNLSNSEIIKITEHLN